MNKEIAPQQPHQQPNIAKDCSVIFNNDVLDENDDDYDEGEVRG